MDRTHFETTRLLVEQIEGLLEQRYGATGDGLHAKISSVQHLLSANMAGRLRYIATFSNKLLRDNASMDWSFPGACNAVIAELTPPVETKWDKIQFWVAMGLAILMAVGFGSLGWTHIGYGAGLVCGVVGAGLGLFLVYSGYLWGALGFLALSLVFQFVGWVWRLS